MTKPGPFGVPVIAPRVVEVDETASEGGKPRKKMRQGLPELAQWRESKTTVLGMVERGGKVRLRVIAARRGEPLSGAVPPTSTRNQS